MKLTYTITSGAWGEVCVWFGTKLVAKKLKVACVRSDRDSLNQMMSWIGFNSWRWLGIEVDTLPRGISVEDVAEVYLIARDEIIEAGFCLPETPSVPVA